MKAQRSQSITAVVGTGVALTSLLSSTGTAQAAVCPTPTQASAVIASQVNSNPAVRAADRAHRLWARTLTRAHVTYNSSIAALHRAHLTKDTRRDDYRAYAAYVKARTAYLVAVKNERVTRKRAQAVRARITRTVAAQVTAQAATCTPAVGIPSGVAAVVGNDQVALSWSLVVGALGYRVYRGGTLVATTDVTTYVDGTALNGTPYLFTVRAYSSAGESADSAQVAATPALPAPDGLSASTTSGVVQLHWNPVAHATGYQVLRDGQPLTSTSAAAATDPSAVAGSSHTYAVKAVEPWSTSSASAGAGVAVPTAPTGLAATPGRTQVDLAWNAVPGATSYTVTRDGVPVGGVITGTTFSDLGLTSGASYSYTVASTTPAGSSAASGALVVATIPPAPAAPVGLSATPGDTRVALAWTPTVGATGYRVYRGATVVATTTSASYTDTGLTNGTAYSYRVRATNLGGTSGYSSTVTTTPQPPAPATPTGLTATPGDARVVLSWTAVTGATSYQLFRGATQVGGTITGSTYTDTGLTNGTLYSYTIKAVNGGGASPSSQVVSATPLPPAPSAPTGLASTPGNGSVTLTWTTVTGATTYQVYRDGVAVGAPVATAAFTDSGLANGTSYSYTVTATNLGGTSAPSAALAATPLPPAPATPTGLSAMVGDKQVWLSWGSVTGATGYTILRDGVQVGTATTTSYIDSNLTNGTTYVYTVRATNLGGASPASAPVTAIPAPPAMAPGTPTGLVATPGSTQVVLSWTITPGATSYTLTRDGAPVGGVITGTTYTDTGLTNGTAYTYTLQAVNSVGSSAATAGVTATPQVPAPAAPTIASATPGVGQVTVSWSSVAGATSYQLFRSGTQVGGTIAGTTYTDTGLTNGTAYSYTLKAVNAGGASAASAAVSATPQVAAPGVPTIASAVPGVASVTVSWTAVTGATSYQLFRGATQVGGTITGTTYTDTGLTNGTTYSYTLKAVNAGGASAASAAVSATPQVAAPSTPSGLMAVAGDTSVTVSWPAVAGAASYQLFRGATQVGGTITGTSFTDTGLTNGTLYSYTLKAVNAGGTSAASAAVTSTPQVIAPGVPTIASAVAGNTQVVVSWTAVTGATSYQLFRGATQVGGTITGTTYTDTGLTNGTLYSYTLKAVNAGGASAASAAVSATPQVPAPAAPSISSAVAGNAQVVVSWTAVTGATSYQLFRGATQVGGTITGTTYTDTGLTNGTAYSYTLKAVNAGGASAASATVSATPVAPGLAAPTGVAAGSATNLNTGAFRLTWTAVTGATSYSVYRDGTLLGTATTPAYQPATTPLAALHSYTVTATNGTSTSPASAALSAGPYQGAGFSDQLSVREVYGTIQVTIVVTSTTAKSLTGCYATYPTTSDSGTINPSAIPKLCSQALTKSPTSANATTTITNVSGASCTSPAFASSLQDALRQAGM